MGLFEDNVKMRTLNKSDELKCKCGSVRYIVKIFKDDYDERRWVSIICKQCGAILFYEGA